MGEDIDSNLLCLARDLYSEGYHCGIGHNADKWFAAWVMAMKRVASGQQYTDMMVIEEYNQIVEGAQ